MFFAYVKKFDDIEESIREIDDVKVITSSKFPYQKRLVILTQSSKGADWFMIYNTKYLFHRSWLDCVVEENPDIVVSGFRAPSNTGLSHIFRICAYINGVFTDLQYNEVINKRSEYIENSAESVANGMGTALITHFSFDVCDSCGRRTNTLSLSNDRFCPECVATKTKACSCCGKTFIITENSKVGEKYYCDDCRYKIKKCVHCGETVIGGYEIEGDTYCKKCFSKKKDDFEKCNHCGNMYYKTSGVLNKKKYCGVCDLHIKISSSTINNYTYKPEPEFFGDKYSDPLYYGVELEIVTPSQRENISRYIQMSINNPDEFIYCKFDRSIGNDGKAGFEIVSHPFNYAWLRSDEGTKKIKHIMDLRKYNCRSFDTNTCGMHVHMNKDVFTETQLYKYLYFIFNNKNFIITISEREDMNKVNRYCSFEPEKDIITLAKERTNSPGDYRHKAVNLNCPNTVEVRVFRGTLNYSKFMKNIEFCKSLYDYTQICSIRDLTVDRYKEFIKNNEKRYSYLFGFLTDKKEI